MDQLIQLVESKVKPLMGSDPAHGWPHILRVRRIARIIVEGEGLDVDWLILDLAILLHDAGRFIDGEGHHALKSSRYAQQLLEGYGVDERIIEGVRHAIEAHSYSLGVEAKSIEAMVLSDADKIDALGAIGIARVFHHGCMAGRSFDASIMHIITKIIKLPRILRLEYSRRIARERLGIVLEFLKSYMSEAGWSNLNIPS